MHERRRNTAAWFVHREATLRGARTLAEAVPSFAPSRQRLTFSFWTMPKHKAGMSGSRQPEVRAAGVANFGAKQVQSAQLHEGGQVRKPLVRHVAAVQVQMRQPAQRGDRLQARVADACGCGEVASLGVRRCQAGCRRAELSETVAQRRAGTAVADAGDSRGQSKGTASSCLVCKAMYRQWQDNTSCFVTARVSSGALLRCPSRQRGAHRCRTGPGRRGM